MRLLVSLSILSLVILSHPAYAKGSKLCKDSLDTQTNLQVYTSPNIHASIREKSVVAYRVEKNTDSKLVFQKNINKNQVPKSLKIFDKKAALALIHVDRLELYSLNKASINPKAMPDITISIQNPVELYLGSQNLISYSNTKMAIANQSSTITLQARQHFELFRTLDRAQKKDGLEIKNISFVQDKAFGGRLLIESYHLEGKRSQLKLGIYDIETQTLIFTKLEDLYRAENNSIVIRNQSLMQSLSGELIEQNPAQRDNYQSISFGVPLFSSKHVSYYQSPLSPYQLQIEILRGNFLDVIESALLKQDSYF